MNKLFKLLISFVGIFLFSLTTIGYATLYQDFVVKGYIIMNEQLGVYILTATVVDCAKFYNGKVSGGESTSIDYGSYIKKVM